MEESYNFVIKIILGTEKIDNVVYTKVEKKSVVGFKEAINIYNSYLERGYKPIILKRKGREWNPIEFKQLF